MKEFFSDIISALCPGIRGKRTHLHALIAMVLYAFLMVAAILKGEIFMALFMLALVNHVAAQGASRWTLKAIEKKVQALMDNQGVSVDRGKKLE